MSQYKIAPSILAADYANFEREIKRLEATGAEYAHIDIMDGHFVPQISFGAGVVESLRPHSKMVFDCHLMVANPEHHLEDFARAGADIISIHVETTPHIHGALQKIRSLGVKPSVVINPGTPVEAIKHVLHLVDQVLVMTVNPGFGGQAFLPEIMDKVRELVALRDEKGLNFEIEVDGGTMSLREMSMSEYKLSENNWTRVAVFAGGDRGHYRTDFDSFVGVDRGSLWVLEENLPLALAVGDFDSVTEEERQVIQKRAQHFVQARPEKDDTDLELALLTIFEQNPQAQVTIFGALGGRIDHMLANVFLPSNPKLAPYMRQIAIEDRQNLIAYCPEGTSQLEPRSDYDYLAFMPVRDSQLTILGAKYELTEENFFFKKVYASNEYIDREVSVTCPDGYVVVLHSKDRR